MKEDSGSLPEGASIRNQSRRKFLARASASALSLFVLNRAAHADTTITCTAPCTPGVDCPPCNTSPVPVAPGSPTDIPAPQGCSNVDNIPIPDPWLIRGCSNSTVCGYNAAGIPVTGVRHYGKQDSINDPIPWGDGVTTNPGRYAFPARPDGASFCMSIYPVVSKLLNGDYDSDLEPFFKSFNPREMVSCYHELAGGKTDPSGYCIQPADAVAMQQYLLNFRNKLGLTTPAIGAIECGNGNQGPDPTTNPDHGVSHCKPWMSPGLDFYGNDLYWGNYHNPVAVLNAWEAAFGYNSNPPYTLDGSPSKATIAVCECNVTATELQTNPSARAEYFQQTANWLWNQTNRGARCFLTFWRYSCIEPGLSGPWLTKDQDPITIAELLNIGKGIYSAS